MRLVEPRLPLVLPRGDPRSDRAKTLRPASLFTPGLRRGEGVGEGLGPFCPPPVVALARFRKGPSGALCLRLAGQFTVESRRSDSPRARGEATVLHRPQGARGEGREGAQKQEEKKRLEKGEMGGGKKGARRRRCE